VALGKSLPPEWLASVGRPKVSGTVWVSQLPGGAEDGQELIYFRADGDLIYQDADPDDPNGLIPGAWKQFASRLIYHIEHYQKATPYSFHTARIEGNRLHISSRNVDGVKWRHSMALSSRPPPPDPIRKRRKK
jgi:hypothetical protein